MTETYEEGQTAMESSETAAEATTKVKKATPIRNKVMMDDGVEVEFVGKQNMVKSFTIDGDTVNFRFDFDNGVALKFKANRNDPLAMQYVGHGVVQKVGDETSGDKDVDDKVMHVKEMLERLGKGEWAKEREGGGDSFAGGSVVVRALMEFSKKSKDEVVAFLAAKLEKLKADAEAAGNKAPTRQAMYAAYRVNAQIAPIIQRLEQEKAAKDAAFDADAELAELAG